MKPQKRNLFDLSHFAIQLGRIGRLQTLARIPVLPGDSISAEIAGVWKLPPLRRDLTLDAKVQLFAFYVPYRHIYGDDWLDFIREGNDENVVFSQVNNNRILPYLVCNHRGTIPRYIPAGYNRIWNRYFRPPTEDNSIRSDTEIPSDDVSVDYGIECGWLAKLWSATVDRELSYSSDESVGISGNRLSLLSLEQQKKHLKTEVERQWFSQRYRDVMDGTWGTTVNIDADERPQFVYRGGFWLSGYDVDGTAGDSLGQYAGKSQALGGMRMPSKFFNEHGTLWFMALVRFPTVFTDEKQYLDGKPNPSYKEIAGDPTILASEPPMELNSGDWFARSSDRDIGWRPYGDWYREHPSFCHSNFDELNGFPFYDTTEKNKRKLRYVDSEFYENVFQTTQQGHWRAQLRCNVMAKRYVPDSRSSIFVGTR